jgi:hypothetical protein
MDSKTANAEGKTSLSLKDEKLDLSESPAYGEPGYIEDEFLAPTEEEKETLRRVADTIPWTAFRE